MNSGQRLLALDAIAMTFTGPAGPLDVLDGVTLEVRRGSIVAVAGRSGSGKTTLLRIAGGLLAPTRGVVMWGDQPIGALGDADLAKERRRHVGYVAQSGGLVASLTAIENVALPAIPAWPGASGWVRALHLLDVVGCAARADHLPGELSGGEQQRVVLARAMFLDPPLLLVDEPTANLDRTTAHGVARLLTVVSERGTGILVASHDRNVVDLATTCIELE
jgi:ABC-type lipoprotein export system ATPase subunit